MKHLQLLMGIPNKQLLLVVSKGTYCSLITSIDYLLDRVTIYRLVLYVLIGFIALAAILSYVQLLPFSPLALLLSTVFLVVICWTANSIFAIIFEVPANVESASVI